jgi:hypothetical protein
MVPMGPKPVHYALIWLAVTLAVVMFVLAYGE